MNLFVYGTLTKRDCMMRLLDVSEAYIGTPIKSHVRGFTKYDESATRLPYPVILPDDQGRVDGVMWTGLTVWDLQQLDLYEGVEGGLYKRIEIEVTIREAARHCTELRVKGWIYVGTDERWGHVRTRPTAMAHSEIGKFNGHLPRWIHEAMGKGTLLVDATGIYSDTTESWMLLSTEFDKLYRVETSVGKTTITEMLDDVHTEITFEQLLRTFDV